MTLKFLVRQLLMFNGYPKLSPTAASPQILSHQSITPIKLARTVHQNEISQGWEGRRASGREGGVK
jgi:hypothetical protein